MVIYFSVTRNINLELLYIPSITIGSSPNSKLISDNSLPLDNIMVKLIKTLIEIDK